MGRAARSPPRQGRDDRCVDPKPDLPDLVFTANAAIVLDGKALLSRFRHLERKPEEPVFADAFQTLGRRPISIRSSRCPET